MSAELARLLRPGDTILVGTGAGEPLALIEALIGYCATLPAGAEIRALQVMTGGSERLADAAGGSLRLTAPVPGPKTRKAIAEGRATLLNSSMFTLLQEILSGALPIDGVLIQGRALDAERATLGLAADVMLPAWERARFRVLELNDHLPRIDSAGTLPIAGAQLVVHSRRAPNELVDTPPNEAALRIGTHVARIVPDGATIELGVGRALAGVAPALAARRRDLALHTGLLGDAAMHLIEAGAVSRPVRGTAVAVGATAMGTRTFYAWADANPRIALIDSRLAHDPVRLAALPCFVAINAALQVDLDGNVNSNAHDGRIVSGVGGAGDFAAAGARATGSIIALFATTPAGASTIVPAVEAVSIPAAHVTHIVTEHGIAALVDPPGSPARRARIAAIAAPAQRDRLTAD